MGSQPSFSQRLEFDDVDALGEAIKDWDLEFRQLQRGAFQGHLSQVSRDGWIASHARIAQPTEQVGLPPSGLRTIVVSGTDNVSMRWRNHLVSSDDLLVFPDSGELHAIADQSFHEG